MPAIETHPLRLARIRAGISAEKLAAELKVSRGLVSSIEEGRVRKVRDEYIAVLARANGMKPAALRAFYEDWRAAFDQLGRNVVDQLSPRARAVLQLSPELVARYSSFSAWRAEFAKTPTAFASLLMVSATSLSRYERGEIDTLPKPLIKAISRSLGADAEYVTAVMGLPVRYQRPSIPAIDDYERRSNRRKRSAPDAESTLREARELAADHERMAARLVDGAGALVVPVEDEA